MDKKTSLEQLQNPQWRREQQIKYKNEAIWVAFTELNGLINVSKFATSFLGRSQSWFNQKLNRIRVNGKPKEFNALEAHNIADAFRQLANRLLKYADEIEAAEDDSTK